MGMLTVMTMSALASFRFPDVHTGIEKRYQESGNLHRSSQYTMLGFIDAQQWS